MWKCKKCNGRVFKQTRKNSVVSSSFDEQGIIGDKNKIIENNFCMEFECEFCGNYAENINTIANWSE